MNSRYHRQEILPQIGVGGQQQIGSARVLVIGCGALGTVMAELLARAGVGHLRIVDRDIVEWTNLQRQVLFTENDAKNGLPKAVAAAERLREINSEIVIEPLVTDVDAGNVEPVLSLGSQSPRMPIRGLSAADENSFAAFPDLILDGTDNVETRYLINDAAVKHSIPWVYAAAVGMEGRVMGVIPGRTPCLRCVFPNPPAASELATCDTTGVLGVASAAIASLAVVEGLKLILGQTPSHLLAADVWAGRFSQIDLKENRVPDCLCCGERKFEFLERPATSDSAKLCGRNAVQVRGNDVVDLGMLAKRLTPDVVVQHTPYMLRAMLREPAGVILSVFPDGRVIVTGTTDIGRARSIVARFVGA
ncbi:MAG TPA: ThiF family adenylyltransferase [Tepidisphaeraceae bacterium]|jgi:adenylyltransferase/sulfurtransferase